MKRMEGDILRLQKENVKLQDDYNRLKTYLLKPCIPWRKVSEEPVPKTDPQSLFVWLDDDGQATHWCYRNDLKPDGL